MAITITKIENAKVLETPLYGSFIIKEAINDIEHYTQFDSFNNYNLFISADAKSKIAVEAKSLTESAELSNTDIEREVDKIKEKYDNLDTVKYIETDNTIIVKAIENHEDVIDKIVTDYSNSKDYIPNKLSSTVLFLDLVKDDDIQLEDDDVLNQLDDSTIKNLATKTGAKLNGSESKDELKGIIKGSLTKNN